jgi:hypothetical protein
MNDIWRCWKKNGTWSLFHLEDKTVPGCLACFQSSDGSFPHFLDIEGMVATKLMPKEDVCSYCYKIYKKENQ